MRRKANPALAPTRVRMQTNNCIKKVRWTKEEDELLFQLLKDVDNPNWPFIAKNFPTKTTQQVSERWEKVLNPKLIKGSWTREEDQTIINFVRDNGSKNWTQLAALLPGRIGKQCRERWRNHLDPNINHSMWTNDEDLQLLKLHEKFGNAWVKISQMMPGRSDNAIKNRWNSTLKKVDPQHLVAGSNSNVPNNCNINNNLNLNYLTLHNSPGMIQNVSGIESFTNIVVPAVSDTSSSNLLTKNNIFDSIDAIKHSKYAVCKVSASVDNNENSKDIEDNNISIDPNIISKKGNHERDAFEKDEIVQTDKNSSRISLLSPFKNLISPGIQKVQSSSVKETSPRAGTVESNRQKFLVLLEREEVNDKTDKC
ncbi:hypothetical protein M9Y10_025602 [Tritrichomonas musculus]|uniref:Myb-like DNA-binding domain containing protein n=1 Tax=Tritrichomonas musculus TaxID=1915356 RepID=A0ABR2H951_9EUKA